LSGLDVPYLRRALASRGNGEEIFERFPSRRAAWSAILASRATMTAEEKSRSESALRRELRLRWESQGKSPCPLCGTTIADDDKYQVSLVFHAVVHRLCASHPVCASDRDAANCPGYAHFTRPAWCRCPRIGAVNAIVWARRMGMPVIEVPTALSPGCQRAAQQAGLGSYHSGAPLRESIHYGDLLKDGVITDPALLDKLSSCYEPPETLTLDVNRSIRDGRIVAHVPEGTQTTRPWPHHTS
jgi:hypothetical protein